METHNVLPLTREAGICMHISSLANCHGIGDIGDSAQSFMSQLAAMKLRVWQFLPLGPTAYGDSPYQPLSAFAGNEMLIGIEPLLRQGLLKPREADSLTVLSRDTVDFGALIPAKTAVLQQAARRFSTVADSRLKAAYGDFLHRHDAAWLDDYANYRVLKTLHGEQPWPVWEAGFVHREPGAMRKMRDANSEAISRLKMLQFLFEQQWQALRQSASDNNIRLFGDMPIYIALDSADAWARPELLQIDPAGRPSRVAGVPPDYFSADGQLWGNPLYDWGYHQADGYGWWAERIKRALELADLVRIDHFRGFESFWSVRHGAETAREGEWLPGPGDGLFEALKTVLGALPIVAEDLGIITPEVDALRDRHGIPGMHVLQFAIDDPQFDPARINANRVCYTGTHDNDTTVGWFQGGEDDTRSEEQLLQTRQNALRLTGGTPATIHTDMIRLALASPARLAIAPLQDFLGLGSRARLNIPGTTMNNWRWRVRQDQLSPDFCASVAGMLERASRT